MPQVARIERAREDPSTPSLIRGELDATLEALVRAGLLSPRESDTAARTLEPAD
ncbi:MAG: hypothetical protein KC457_06515 [Myxococcales bacterium]|nr:hypothetical protein [Myxococcales bacterium]